METRSLKAADKSAPAPGLRTAGNPARPRVALPSFTRLQRSLGNQAMQRMISDERLQITPLATLDTLGPTVQRQDQAPAEATSPPGLPPLTIPGTGLTVFPGPLSPGLFGSRLPLPASLRLTNALSVGTTPTFVLDLSPNLLVGTILDDITLSVSPRPGTPPGRENEPENQMRLRLVRPILRFDPRSRTLRGSATLSVPSEYPPGFAAPFDVDVEITSTELGRFSGNASYGPLNASFQLQLRYDTDRVLEALRPATALTGSGLRQAGTNVATELTHPGFNLRGTARLGSFPITTFSATAPTTVPLARPLPGAPASFPLTTSAGGVVIAPPGSLFDVPAPALGYTRSSFGERSGTSLTVAALPTLSPSAISAGEPTLNQFPAYAYAEFYNVNRVSKGLDLGIRVTASISSPEVVQLFTGGGAAAPLSAEERFRRTLTDYQGLEAERGKPAAIKPNFFFSVEGRFDAF